VLKVYPWQTSQWQRIESAHAQGRLPHALLLTGAEGLGLHQFAYGLAAKLLCTDKTDTESFCGNCKACVLFQAGNHPDLYDIQAEEAGKQIKVDVIRQLITNIYVTSQYGEYKLAIINPAEAMNASSANSLLKTLEEPPINSLFILISSRPNLLPVTIRSRCQRINFTSENNKEARDWLRTRLQTEDIDIESLLTMAQGAPLKALALFESDALAQQETLLEDLQSLRVRESDPIKVAEKWLAQDATQVLCCLINFFIAMSRLKLGAPANNSTIHRHLQRLIKGLDLLQLVHCHEVLLRHHRGLTGSISLNKKGLLEDFIVYWQSISNQAGG
jgi:DNA polymerase III subunit delta'